MRSNTARIAIAVGAIAVIVVLFVVLNGGDDGNDNKASTTTTTQSTTSSDRHGPKPRQAGRRRGRGARRHSPSAGSRS